MTKYEQLQEHLKSSQNTWLVTGVAGFIGSNLLEKLLILNQKVVGLDNLDTGYQHNIDQAIEDANKAIGEERTSLNKLYQIIEERPIQRTEGLERREPVYRGFRAGDVRHSQANIDKAQTLLDYQPKYIISQGMDEAMDWYIKSLKKC